MFIPIMKVVHMRRRKEFFPHFLKENLREKRIKEIEVPNSFRNQEVQTKFRTDILIRRNLQSRRTEETPKEMIVASPDLPVFRGVKTSHISKVQGKISRQKNVLMQIECRNLLQVTILNWTNLAKPIETDRVVVTKLSLCRKKENLKSPS
jgi:hypothetical protein